MLGEANDGGTSISVGILRNNLAYGDTTTSNTTLGGGLISDEFNSWDPTLDLAAITDADFQSVAFAPPASCPEAYIAGGTVCVPPTDTTSFAGMASARQADGSLPILPFLRLAAKSELIGKGTDVGLPFSGSAPDLGCFDTTLAFDPTDGGGALTDASAGGAEGGSSSDGSSASPGDSEGSASGDAGGAASSTDAGGTGAEGGSGGANGEEGDGASGNTSKGGCGCRAANAGGAGAGVSVLALGLLGMVARRRKSSSAPRSR
jgi:MYXO-CTERM domain-containing protein